MFSEEKVVRNLSGPQVVRAVRETQSLRKLHILFVDNDRGACERIQHALGDEFYIQCVATSAEAQQFLNETLPDIVISEVVLGQESGLDLCRAIRALPSMCNLPIMLLTSLTTTQDKITGFSAGADDYVVKPFDVHHLQARIRLLARIKRLEKRTSI